MRAEFQGDYGTLPVLMIIADDIDEWRALQLYFELMGYGKLRVSARFDPPKEKENE